MVTISAGLVIIYDNKILLAHPTGQKWYETYSIPKGHVEEGEDHLETAIRETKEEVGLEFNIDETEPLDEGYIEYKDANGDVYKKVHYFVIKLSQPAKIDFKKLQKNEVDWAGFLDKEQAEKRIFWRFRPLLKYLDKPMIKLVKESLYEKFSEEGDPIQDMGIGLLPKYKDVLEKQYKWIIDYPESKDIHRVEDIIKKASGDKKKENKLAATMAKLITDRKKAYRRYLAAKRIGGDSWDVTQIFLQKAGELHNIV